MAGNLVKWWKHKILGGYKQFSVQECPTDSEELMYHHQVRASSSCSAPPDLLLVNDRENNVPLRTDVTDVFSGTRTPPPNSVNACPDLASVNNNKKINQHQQQKQQPQSQLPQHAQMPSHIYNSNIESGKKVIGGKQAPHHFDIDGHGEKQQGFSTARQAHHQHQPRSEEHIRLEEFTCDVSVEGGKSSQPLQFSFTFYDLDGHHGKITKDDIVGIVYTIYESIGKSVVVPHSGSKTINVRLTVSPEGKSKAKKQQNVASQKDGVITSARRLHRYRPRNLIKSDEDDDDSNSDKEREGGGATAATNVSNHIVNKSSKNSRVTKTKVVDQQCCQQPPQQCMDANNHERVYEHSKKVETGESCRECLTAAEGIRKATISPTRHSFAPAGQFPSKSASNEAYMKHIASTRIKMLRKSRKQKYQDCMATRQRSLSVGSESCWNNRHLTKSTQHPAMWHADPCFNGSDMLDGVQMRNPLRSEKLPMTQKRNSAECWKSALNRNDLISIIRESMEKNRLCFQLNGKPQANVSPIRQSSGHQHISQHKHAERQATQHHRQRSNTVSKIPMLIANHSNRYSSVSINNDLSPSEHHSNASNSNNIYQLKPHIPIYDTHVPINPIALTPTHVTHANVRNVSGPVVAHSKTNLCGYDSFLHATICGGGLGDSPPHTQAMPMHSSNQPGANASSPHSLHQQIATVQPIMSSLNANAQSTPRANMGLSLTPNQIRTSKILRSGSYSQAHQAAALTAQNSPQQHGYQRLCSSNRPPFSLEKTQLAMLEKVRKEQAKNYDQLLYAKLTEKLQQTNLATTNKENMQRRRHRVLRHRRTSFSVPEANKVCVSSASLSKANDFSAFLPIGADPIECENLIVPTSDDECHSHHSIETNDDQRETEVASTRGVVVGTLVNLDDNHGDIKADATHQTITSNAAMLDLEVGNIDIKIHNEVVVEEEPNEDLGDGDGEDIGMKISGRGSAASNEEIEDTVANANSANTSATSSLIHRYVHEHIHHHYHHFEDKNE